MATYTVPLLANFHMRLHNVIMTIEMRQPIYHCFIVFVRQNRSFPV